MFIKINLFFHAINDIHLNLSESVFVARGTLYAYLGAKHNYKYYIHPHTIFIEEAKNVQNISQNLYLIQNH